MFEDTYFLNNGFLPDGLICTVIHNNIVKLGPTGLSSKPSLSYNFEDGIGNDANFQCEFGNRNIKLYHTDLCEDAISRMSSGNDFHFFKSCFTSLIALGFEDISTFFGTRIPLENWEISTDNVLAVLAEAKAIQEIGDIHAH